MLKLQTFIHALMVSVVILGLSFSGSASAASACKGVKKSACSTNSSCSWVDSYKTKSGTQVKGHCRTKAGKAKTKKSGTADKVKKSSGKSTEKASKSAKQKTNKANSKAKSTSSKSKSTAKKSTEKVKKANKKKDKKSGKN